MAYGCSRTDFKLASPIAGLLADRIGSGYITCICLLLTLPWWIVLALRKSIALFIIALALQSERPVLPVGSFLCASFLGFFVSGVVPPVTAELAAVSRNMPGVGCKSSRLSCILVLTVPYSRCSCIWGFQSGLWCWNCR